MRVTSSANRGSRRNQTSRSDLSDLCQETRAQPIVLLGSRKTPSARRKRSVVGGASMGYQFGQTRDRVLGRRGILGFPIRLEILDTKELEPARRYLLLSREQCSELDIARMHFDLQNRLLANLEFHKPKVLYRKRNG